MNTDNPEVFILFIITICFGLFFFFKLVMSLFPNPLLAPHVIATHLEHHVADKRVLGATNHIFCLQLRQGNRLWGRLEEQAQSPKLWDCPQLLWNTGHKPLPSPTHRKVLLFSKPSVNSQKLLQQGSIPQTSVSIHMGLLKLKAESAAICPHLLQAGHRRTTSTPTAQG